MISLDMTYYNATVCHAILGIQERSFAQNMREISSGKQWKKTLAGTVKWSTVGVISFLPLVGLKSFKSIFSYG